MNVRALAVFLPQGRRIGILFQYQLASDTVTTRFVADESFARSVEQPTVSLSYLAPTQEEQLDFWRDVTSTTLNGSRGKNGDWLLPTFFQNLLPEGVFRDHVAAARGCSPTDHFEMLAACGADLPGGIYALPVDLEHDELARLVTQGHDALEPTVVAAPLEEGVSLSGVQPKMGVIEEGGRYVGRTKDGADKHIIAKLPTTGYPQLPQVEELSLRLAAAAGVDVCSARLEPMSALEAPHHYLLEDEAGGFFLAVERFDRGAGGNRGPQGRVHCEDFAQVLGAYPDEKYGLRSASPKPLTYLDIARVLMSIPSSLGEPAVHELLRRIAVNEMLGNPDMHLKNIGLIYRDGVVPTLSPAYDVVAYAAYLGARGHALHIIDHNEFEALPRTRTAPTQGEREKQRLGPVLVRHFCAQLGIPEKPAIAAIRRCASLAKKTWPQLIEQSSLAPSLKKRLLEHFQAHPFIQQRA